jgi:hypothetical protein
MIIEQLIEQSKGIVGSGTRDGQGQACIFFGLTDTIGIKTYSYRGDAEKTRRRQIRVAEVDLAPAVLSEIFTVESVELGVRHCYLVERVRVIGDMVGRIANVPKETYLCCAQSGEGKEIIRTLEQLYYPMVVECANEITNRRMDERYASVEFWHQPQRQSCLHRLRPTIQYSLRGGYTPLMGVGRAGIAISPYVPTT